MLQPRTINETILPLIVMNCLVGMGTLQCRISRVKRIFFLIHSILCIVGYGILARSSIEYLELFVIAESSDLSDITSMALVFGNTIMTVCLIITGWMKIKDMNMVITRLEICDQNMERMGIPKNYRRLLLNQIICIGFFLVIMLIFIAMNYYFMFSGPAPLINKLFLLITVQYPAILMSVADLSFYFWVRCARLKFQDLNNVLRRMLTTTPQSPQHKRVLAMKYDLLNKTFNSARGQRPRGSNDNTGIMKDAKQVHLDLVKFARCTNEVYGLQILLTMTASFVFITGLLYDAYMVIWFNTMEDNLLDEIIPVGCWTAFYAFKIFLVNHTCEKTSAEAADTGDIICELYEPSTSREFRAEIRDFTLQLIQNPLTFTACGFFDLDHTFIQGVIGSITTYLVILIQVGEIPTPDSFENETALSNETGQQTVVPLVDITTGYTK